MTRGRTPTRYGARRLWRHALGLVLPAALAVAAPRPLRATPAETIGRSAPRPVQTPDLLVLANGTGLAELDSAGLRAVFRGERSQWPSDRRVVVVLPSSRAGFADVVSRALFRSTPGGMQRFWLALVFQGRADPPIFVDSVDDMVALVRRTPGAVALVPRDSVSAPGSLLLRVR